MIISQITTVVRLPYTIVFIFKCCTGILINESVCSLFVSGVRSLPCKHVSFRSVDKYKMPVIHQLLDFTHCNDSLTPPFLTGLQGRLQEVIDDGTQWIPSEQAVAGGFVLLLTNSDGCRLTFQYSDKGWASLDVFQPIATQNSPSKFTRQVNFSLAIGANNAFDVCLSGGSACE